MKKTSAVFHVLLLRSKNSSSYHYCSKAIFLMTGLVVMNSCHSIHLKLMSIMLFVQLSPTSFFFQFLWVKILALHTNIQTYNLVASVFPGIHSDFSPKNFIPLLSKAEISGLIMTISLLGKSEFFEPNIRMNCVIFVQNFVFLKGKHSSFEEKNLSI